MTTHTAFALHVTRTDKGSTITWDGSEKFRANIGEAFRFVVLYSTGGWNHGAQDKTNPTFSKHKTREAAVREANKHIHTAGGSFEVVDTHALEDIAVTTRTPALGEEPGDRYITLVEVGDDTEFEVNHWTNTLEYTPTGARVVNVLFSSQGWTTLEEALPTARKVERDSRYPGENVYILRSSVYNDGDVEGVAPYRFYLALGGANAFAYFTD